MNVIAMHDLEERPDFWLTPCPAGNRPVRVTVVVPTFSAEATLERAVRSALDQSIQDIEVIIVDDASPDGSWTLIRSLMSQDSRLRAVRNKRNCGKSAGMNRGISLARGRWLAVLDADDWYDGDRLSALVDTGERWNAELVADNQNLHDAVANQTVGTAWKPREMEWELTFSDFLKASNPYANFNLGMLKPIIRTDFMRRTGLDYEEQARDGHDYLHLLQFYLAGGRAVINDLPYYHYTQPFGTISHQWSHVDRRRYDFATIRVLGQRLAAEADGKLTRPQRMQLRLHDARLRVLEHFFRARERLRARDVIGLARQLVLCPSILGYVVWKIGHRLSRRADVKVIEELAEHAKGLRAEPAAA